MKSNKKRMLFVCTSNTCRSPMAAGIAEKWCRENSLLDKYEILSGGLTEEYEPPGSKASKFAIDAMARRGIDIKPHRSCILSSDDLKQADRIYCVTERHKNWILEIEPSVSNRIFTLGTDIPDPWHQNQKVYEQCAASLNLAIISICEKENGTPSQISPSPN